MAERLKDMFFTRTSIEHLAQTIRRFYPKFDEKRFLNLIYEDDWEQMALKERMRHTTQCLGRTLPSDYAKALAVLKKAIPHITGFDVMVFPDFVEVYGQDHWERSMSALKFFTRYASGEFAIRPFLKREPERTIARMQTWAGDSNPHVRRLASEGSRPRLPWAMALPQFNKDPKPVLAILEALREDPDESVRRSVANNLNDISKNNPDLVLDVCERWAGRSESTDWIIKHACRTLLKAGNERAMKLFGFGDSGQITADELEPDRKKLRIGEDLSFSFRLEVEGRSARSVRLEYIVHFARAKGRTSKKVFRISERTYGPGSHIIRKKHAFKDLSTRKHYAGRHRIVILVNGQERAEAAFDLLPVQ